MNSKTRVPRFIWCVFDGMRRDMITPQDTPHLHAFMAQGADFPSSRSVFPSVTRVNAAAMACGAIPAATGIVANKLFDPTVFRDQLLHTGRFDDITAAQRAYQGRFVETPALGELMSNAGLSLAVVSTGSAGTTHLLNPRAPALRQVTLCLSDWRLSTPADYAQQVLERFGPLPAAAVPNLDRLALQTEIALEAVIPDIGPDGLILWFTDPDATYHRYGIGSAQSLAAIRQVDAQLGRVLAWRSASPEREDCRVIVCSDHGQVTGRERIDIRSEAAAAGLPIAEPGMQGMHGMDDGAFVGSIDYCGTIRVMPPDPARLRRMADWLMEQPWCGPVFTTTRTDTEGIVPGTFSLALAGIDHTRTPQLCYTMAADDRPNEWGLPGSCAYDSPEIRPGGGIHGGLHPIEMNNLLGMNGTGIRRGYVSNWAASHTDIVPTILHWFGLAAPASVTGRVLAEALAGEEMPADPEPYTVEVRERARSQHLALWRVGGSVYIDRGWVQR